MMENGVFDRASSLIHHSYMAIDGFSTNMMSGSLIQSGSSDHGKCRQILHTDPHYFTYKEEVFRNITHNVNSSITCSSLFTLEEMRNGIPISCCSTPNLSSKISICSESVPQLDTRFLTSQNDDKSGFQLYCKEAYDEFSENRLPSTLSSTSVHSSYLVGSSEQGFLSFDNELSLRLGSSQPSVLNFSNANDKYIHESCFYNANDQYIDESYSSSCCGSKDVNEMHNFAHDYNSLFENQQKLPFYHGSSLLLLDWRYLHAIQEIFAEFTSYALEDVEEIDDSLTGVVSENKLSSSSCSIVKGFTQTSSNDLPFCFCESEHEEDKDCRPQEQLCNSKKSELINMLEMVDQRFNQFIDQIHNVVSAFHATAKLGSNLPAQFLLRTISSFYKTIRNKITEHIASNDQEPRSECMQEEEGSFDSSFLKRQCALQQLKQRDQPSWRPQRGLPEKSVSVLRAWMFQNFLHPYPPKDNEKQLLALRSGLTKNQVSNWFINARVRLWKPMIEEMYTEINKKSRAKGSGSQHIGHGNSCYQRN